MVLLAACGSAALPVAAGGVVRLHYQERQPYSHTGAGGEPEGLLISQVARAFERAGVPFTWVRTPSQRQLVLIQEGDGPDCGVGWFRNPQREARGRFSAPIYQDRPFMALARADAAWEPGQTLAVRLADAARPLLVKEGYSYGPLFDGLIRQHPATVRQTSAESVQMARMIEAGRATWMIVAPEEADALMAEVGPAAASLRLLPLAGAPPGQTRHLYCNTAVAADVLERVNRALAER